MFKPGVSVWCGAAWLCWASAAALDTPSPTPTHSFAAAAYQFTPAAAVSPPAALPAARTPLDQGDPSAARATGTTSATSATSAATEPISPGPAWLCASLLIALRLSRRHFRRD